HLLSGKGIGIDPDKLKEIDNWSRPENGEQLQKFLGFATFLRSHVRHFADLTGPLEAVKYHKVIEWTPFLIEQFELTKEAIKRAPFLQFPDYSRSFHLATDASITGIGGVL